MDDIDQRPAGDALGEDAIGHHHAIVGIFENAGDGSFQKRDADALGGEF